MAALYSDEDFPHPVVERLRALGHDVLTALDAGQANKKIPGDQVLSHATALGRAVLTYNRRDYIRLHKLSAQHAGVIVCTHDADTDAAAQRIHGAVRVLPNLRRQLVRIVRENAAGKPAPASFRALPIFSVEHQLHADEGICAFDFFQSIRWLTLLRQKERVQVGRDGPPQREIVRFLAHLSLAFPASAMQKMVREAAAQPALMTVNFMGLTGPNGVLPRPYTERLFLEARGPEKNALQDWLDLFNHRFISLFYRAWEKYHFYLPFERGDAFQRDPDPFSRALFSLIGLGFRSHRNRFRVVHAEHLSGGADGEEAPLEAAVREKELARLDDLPLLRFGGLFAHRPRCATSLEIFLQVYLKLPVKVLQFQGQWLHLNESSQSAVGASNNRLGQDTLVGDRIWDVQSKVRIRLGPLSYVEFLEFLPDRTPLTRRKRIFLLAQLVQFYLGAELDVEFQLLLKKDDVPAAETGPHSRLGWNTWSRTQPYPRPADDTVFAVADRVWVNAGR